MPASPPTRSPDSSSSTPSRARPTGRRLHASGPPAARRGGVRGRPAAGRPGRWAPRRRAADHGPGVSALVGAGPRRPPVWCRGGLRARSLLRRRDARVDAPRARRATRGLDRRAGRGPSRPRPTPARRRAGATRTGADPWAPTGRACHRRRARLDDRSAGRRPRRPPRRPRGGAGAAPDPHSPITRYGFASYRAWLGSGSAPEAFPRCVWPTRAMPPRSGGRWTRAPGAAVEADAYELFRAISGRRRLDGVARWS